MTSYTRHYIFNLMLGIHNADLLTIYFLEELIHAFILSSRLDVLQRLVFRCPVHYRIRFKMILFGFLKPFTRLTEILRSDSASRSLRSYIFG